MKHEIISLALAALTLVPILDRPDDEAAAQARARLAAVAKTLEGVTFSRARYTQTQNLATLLRPRVSKGTLYFREDPACLLLFVDPDAALRIRMDETSHRVYRPKDKRAERYVFQANHLNRALMRCFTSEIASIEKTFEIAAFRAATDEGGPSEIDLAPRDEKTKSFLTLLTLRVAASGDVQAIEYTDPGGDVVTIALEAPEHARPGTPEGDALREEIQGLFDAPLPDDVQLFERTVEARE